MKRNPISNREHYEWIKALSETDDRHYKSTCISVTPSKA